MASVNTSVGVRDNMSAAFGNMAMAINACLGTFIDMQSATNEGFNTAQIEAARGAMLDVQSAAGQLENEIRQAEEEQRRFNQTASQGSHAMDGMLKKAMGLVGAYASWQAVEKVVETADSLTNATARIDMMNDGLKSTDEVMQQIYQSAQNARGSYMDMANVVAKLGNNAGSAFDNNTEQIIQFAELVQKQFTIAGASGQEASNAMLQLTQGLGSGVLRGDELNSVFEQAPNLIRTIADYMGVSIGEIRELASEGQITADIVKNAMFSASDEINEKFASMPTTWAQVGQSISNQAMKTFQPILQMIGKITMMDEFQTMVSGISNAFSVMASIAFPIIEFMINGAAFIVDNWGWIAPVLSGVVGILLIYLATTKGVALAQAGLALVMGGFKAIQTFVSIGFGVLTGNTAAASAAMFTYNSALLACPLTWILIIIIAVIAAVYGIVGAINKVTGSTISATGVIVGALSAFGAFIANLLMGLLDIVLGVVNYWYNIFAGFANFFGNLFNDPIASVIHLFGDMADAVLGVLQTIASAMDKVFGTNMAGTVAGWRSGLSDMIETTANKYGNGSYEAVMGEMNLSSATFGLDRIAYTDAYNWGYEKGEGIDQSIANAFNLGGMDEMLEGMEELGDYESIVAGNTGNIAGSLEVSEDNMAWMKDIAEREVIDRTVFRDIKVDLGGVNNVVNNMADLDGVGQYLADSIAEQMAIGAEGV